MTAGEGEGASGATWARAGRALLGLLLAGAIVFGGAAEAAASVILNVSPARLGPLTVGQTAVPAMLSVSNASDGSEATADVTLDRITLVPSCDTFPNAGDCPRVDPGVLRPSATGVGATGTACAGITFTITEIDHTQGKYRFTPSTAVVLGPAGSSVAPLDSCVIDYTVDVVRMPAASSNPDAPGIVTEQAAFAQATAPGSGPVVGSGSGSNEVAIARGTVTTLPTHVSISQIPFGSSFNDAATPTAPAGAVVPTGTVTFDVYGPNDATCTGPVAFTSTNGLDSTGTLAVSGTFTPVAGGIYRVVATYSGDANYTSASSSCADPNESVDVTVPVPVATRVSPPGPIVLGNSFSDRATLGPPASRAPLPTGTVTFDVYLNDPGCSTAPVLSSTNGFNADTATADSDLFLPRDAGTYTVVAAYSGDTFYSPSITSCGDPGETLVVNKAPLAITSTQVNPAAITLGGSFTDTAAIALPPGGVTMPTGSVTFNVYGPGDTGCAGPVVLSSTNPINVSDSITAVSGNLMPAAAGTYRVIATYSGDANYQGSSTACGDSGEAVAVAQAALPIATQVAPAAIALGATFQDTANLGPAPAGAPAPTGSVKFAVYGPGDTACATPVATSTGMLNAAGTTAVSAGFLPRSTGTFRVVATYAGDANFSGSSSSCTDPAEAVAVAPATLALTTQVAPAAITAGASFHDTASLGPAPAGEPPPTGSVTFNVYGPVNSACTGTPAFTSTNTVGGTGTTATSSDFTPTAAGTYRVVATYTGDPDYAPASSPCADPAEAVVVGSAPPPPPARPTLTGVTPASGPTTGGNGVVIFGTNLGGATAVDFGSAAAPVLSVSTDGTQLATIAPPGSGTVDVSVTTPAGTTPLGVADRYSYVVAPPAPAVTSVTPASGPAAGGTAVVIAGSNLAGATAVSFGATPASGFVVDNPNQITATAPAGTGLVDVTVTTTGGTSAAGASDQFIYVAPGPGPGPGPGPAPGPGTPRQPVLQTGAPKVISSSSAEFTAIINPEGLPTTMHFDYAVELPGGAGAAAITYDQHTPEQVVGSDFADHTVTAEVASLLPNSTYHVRAVAANPSGVTPSGDTTFKTSTDPKPPPPVLGQAFNAVPVSGIVYVLVPGGSGHVAQAHASAAKGVGFIPLTEARQLPVGTIFDATHGVARLTTATASKGRTQTGDFGSGLFKLLQNRRERGLSEVRLIAQSTASRICTTASKAGTAQTAAKRALPKTVLNLLRANVKGKFRTRGRFSSATVRGTKWTTGDRCDGTRTAVTRGVVVVSDFRARRQIVLRAGQSYLAKAP